MVEFSTLLSVSKLSFESFLIGVDKKVVGVVKFVSGVDNIVNGGECDNEGDGGGVLHGPDVYCSSIKPSGEGLGEGGNEARINSSNFSMHSITKDRSARVNRSTASIT